jgi:hypothetical protein
MQLKNLKRREFIRLGGISIAGSVLIPSLIRKKKDSNDIKFSRSDNDLNGKISKSNILQNEAGVDTLTEEEEPILV